MPAPRTAPPSYVARAAAVSLLLAACSSGGGGTTSPATGAPHDAVVAVAPAGGNTPGALVFVDDPRDVRQTGPRDPLQIVSARVDGDTLRLTVQYGGGCAQHALRLIGTHVFMESNPVQTGILLGHDAQGDRCRALVRPDVAFSLAPLADAYRQSYRTNGTIVLHLEGWEPALRYTF